MIRVLFALAVVAAFMVPTSVFFTSHWLSVTDGLVTHRRTAYWPVLWWESWVEPYEGGRHLCAEAGWDFYEPRTDAASWPLNCDPALKPGRYVYAARWRWWPLAIPVTRYSGPFDVGGGPPAPSCDHCFGGSE